MNLAFNLRSISSAAWLAFGLSVSVHIGVMFGFGPYAMSAPQPGMFEPIEVVLVGEPAPDPSRQPVAEPAATSKNEKPETTREQDNSADNVADAPEAAPENAPNATSETVVESRYDAAALNNPKPPYPLAARRNNAQGRVVLSVQVSASGASGDVQLKHSSGHAILDNAALQTIRRWRFIPARRGDTPVESWVDVPIIFRLES